ncbi:hypothetical protein BAY06_12825 [Elizabethkingia anophelis]|uniref:hypothetical protein n=1 Tax=Elizabethkingia anophelis TaxID=1117645 RepID=UPI00099AAAEA|nr:hypothetical protein [Elizabethkingia anophelis]OPC54598.1 hypothetical protein BAY06_12825 [Elizabethkingia anophelis]
MAYSQIEQETFDLDIFFKDNNKNVHLATGGGQIPKIIAELDTVSENIKNFKLETLNIIYEIEVNPNLSEIINIKSEEELENYLIDFKKYAKMGFYSYDKTNIGNFNDMQFHLVAKPKSLDINLDSLEDLKKMNINLPLEFTIFNLEYNIDIN